jgi:hypothetical protein
VLPRTIFFAAARRHHGQTNFRAQFVPTSSTNLTLQRPFVTGAIRCRSTGMQVYWYAGPPVCSRRLGRPPHRPSHRPWITRDEDADRFGNNNVFCCADASMLAIHISTNRTKSMELLKVRVETFHHGSNTSLESCTIAVIDFPVLPSATAVLIHTLASVGLHQEPTQFLITVRTSRGRTTSSSSF